MSDIVIKAEGIGKSYLIGHQSNKRYVALRDVIVNKTKGLWSKIRSPRSHTHKDIEEFWALKDVSFEVKQGERIGIIGRNGAGKSTLLKILSRITEPTTGRVSIKGRVASLLEVGTGFHPELTGRENIYLNGAILGMTRREIKAKFDEIVAFAEVEKFLDTPVKRFSSGMYVRLAFAVAAHLEPEILVVDEVLAVGDVSFQKKCLGKLGEATKEGRTVLFVSHNMGQIRKLCSRCIWLDQGIVKKDGIHSVLVDEYLRFLLNILPIQSNEKILSAQDEPITLESFRIFGSEYGEPLQTGKPCNVELCFNFGVPIMNAGFIVLISTLQEEMLLYLSTLPISGFETGKCSGRIKCVLKIDELTLAGGHYTFSVGLSIPMVKYLIPVTKIAQVDVLSSDYYNSGRFIECNDGFLVARHSWDICSE